MSSNTAPVTFIEAKSRVEEMCETTEAWVDDLASFTDEVKASAEFREWLDGQLRGIVAGQGRQMRAVEATIQYVCELCVGDEHEIEVNDFFEERVDGRSPPH